MLISAGGEGFVGRPQWPFEINPDSRLARDLAFFFIPEIRAIWWFGTLVPLTQQGVVEWRGEPVTNTIAPYTSANSQYLIATSLTPSIAPSTPLTLVTWLRCNVSNAAMKRAVALANQNHPMLSLSHGNTVASNQLALLRNNEPNTAGMGTNAAPEAGRTYLLGTTHNGGSALKLYVDGIEPAVTASGNVTARELAINAVHIAGSGITTLHYPFFGTVPWTAAWTRVLSGDEMRALYNPETRWDFLRVSGNRVVFDLGERLPATDNFNRADDTTLGPNWTQTVLTTGFDWVMGIENNQARATSFDGGALAYWNADKFAVTQYAQAVPKAAWGACGPALRVLDRSGQGKGYYFYGRSNLDGGGNGCEIRRHDGGQFNWTSLQTMPGTYINATTDVIRGLAIGSTLIMLRNGAQIGTNQTDATFTDGHTGICIATNNTNAALLDDWEGGNLAFPTIKFNNSTGSDTAASGAGPATAVTGTAAAHTNGAASTTITLTNSPDLSGVAIDGSAALWVATASGRQWSRILAKDNTAKTVTVEDSFTIALASAVDYAIGGKRNTPWATSSVNLFSTSLKAGWTVDIEETGAPYIGTEGISVSQSGDEVNGPITIMSSSATRPELYINANASIMYIQGTRVVFRHLKFSHPASINDVTTNLLSYLTGAGIALFEDCDFDGTGNKVTNGLLLSGNPTANNVTIRRCYFHDLTFNDGSGVQFVETGTQNYGIAIYDCFFENCDVGVYLYRSVKPALWNNVFSGGITAIVLGSTNTTSGHGAVIRNNTIDDCSDDAIDILRVGHMANVMIANNQFSNVDGYGVNLSAGAIGEFQRFVHVDHNNFGPL